MALKSEILSHSGQSGDCRLSAEGIEAGLRHRVDLRFFECTDSTNNEAKRMLSAGFEGTGLIVARSQSAGRGRLGRSFYSPAGSGVYFSLCKTMTMTTATATAGKEGSTQTAGITRITAAAAVAVCETIENLTGLRPSVKWVNDICLGEKKICGILSEAVADAGSGRVESVIVGIGVNVTTSDFPGEIAGKAGSLGVPVPPAALIAGICDRLLDFWENPADPAVMAGYRERSMVIGKEIDFYSAGQKHSGTALGIGDDGGLIVDCSGRRIVLRSGEISVRPKGEPL